MWLSDLRIVLPDRVLENGSLRIEDGIIAEISAGSAPNPAPSLRGLTAIPGIIDLHGDMLERDIEPRPGARFPNELGLLELDKRLAASGITTAYAAISFAWKQDDIRSQETATALINVINDQRHTLLVDFKVHARFEVTNPLTAPVLADLLRQKKVDLVSIMDHTPGQGQYGDVDRYINFVQTWIGVDLDVFEPGLQARLVDQIRKSIGEQAQRTRDWEIVRDVARIAQEYRIPLASHDDDTVRKVFDQAELGVTISEFPINLEAAREAHRQRMWIIMGAPNAYRKQSTGNNLSALEAIKAGLVDILATDYYPPAMLHAAFQLADEGILPLHESIKLISQNPAEAMHLNDRGRIEVGRSADLVLVEPGVHHRVRATIRQGVPIYWDAHMAKLATLAALNKENRMKHFDVYPEALRLKHEKALSEAPTIYEDCMIVDSDIGAWTEIGRGTTLIESSMGDYSYAAGDDDIIYTEIGKFCSIASNVRINPGNHPMQRVTQHHMTYRRKKFGFGDEDDAEFFAWRRAHRCVIGNDVWIGHGVTIMPGVRIGTGAVIGAGAVVTKDVEPYQIVGGVPAHLIRKRFSDEIITQLLDIAWWEWDRATLEARFEAFYDMDAFIAKYRHA